MLRPVDLLARSLKPLALVRVTVPSRDRSHRLISSARIRREIEATLLSVCTGTTTLKGLGTWRDGGPRPVRERILIVESYMPANLGKRASRSIATGLSRIALRARQDALFVVVNGRPILLPGF